MTVKQDETSKLVQRIIMSVASVACVFILSSANSRLGNIEDKLGGMKSIQDIDGATFRVKFSVNDARIGKLEKDVESLKVSVKQNNKILTE